MYKKILIATDGSELGMRGVTHGLNFAKTLNVPAVVVTVTEFWSSIGMASKAENTAVDPTREYEKGVAEGAKKILEVAGETAKTLGVACETVHVPDQHPAEGIADTASSKSCDVIVMASHGRRGMRKALLGSVTTEVLAHSAVPVLMVR
jgi:nucleotide-binding universal stress UspA family protein